MYNEKERKRGREGEEERDKKILRNFVGYVRFCFYSTDHIFLPVLTNAQIGFARFLIDKSASENRLRAAKIST